MHRMGTVANIVRYLTAPDGTHHLVCQGEQRFQIVEYLSGWPFLVARVQQIPEPDVRTPEIEARFVNLQGAGASRRCNCCRRRRRTCWLRSSRSTPPAALTDLAIATWT